MSPTAALLLTRTPISVVASLRRAEKALPGFNRLSLPPLGRLFIVRGTGERPTPEPVSWGSRPSTSTTGGFVFACCASLFSPPSASRLSVNGAGFVCRNFFMSHERYIAFSLSLSPPPPLS